MTFALKAFMLVSMLVGAVSGAWAQKTSTLTFTAACGGSGTADDGVEWTVTSDGDESNFDNTKGIHYGTGKVEVQYIALSTSGITGTITKIVVNASTASGVSATVGVTVGGASFGGNAQTLSTTATDYTFSGSATGEIVVTVEKPESATKALYVKSIAVTYADGGDNPTPTLEESNLALTGAPVALSFDLYNNKTAQTISYTTSSTGEVSVDGQGFVSADVNQQAKTITVTPMATTNGTVEITVSQAADETYKAGKATFTVNVTDSTPGDTPGDDNGESIDFAAQGYGDTDKVDKVESDNYTITFDKGSNRNNSPKYYDNGSAIRAYGGNTFTVASTCNKNISSIVISFGSSDGSNEITASAGTYSDGTWTGDAESVTFTIGGTSGNRRLAGITVIFADDNDTRLSTVVSIDASGITNNDVYVGTAAGKLAATVSVKDGAAIESATVAWSGDNDEVATIAADGTVTLVAVGSVTFTATYAGDEENYKGNTATYELTVINGNPNKPGATAENPYTVAEARAAIDAGKGVNGVYATGIVSKIVTAYNPEYGNISYNISADGSEDGDQLRAYRGFDKDGEWFTSEDDVQVGDVVVIYGNLKKYNDIYEFDADNQRVSYTRLEENGLAYNVEEVTLVEGERFEAAVLSNPNNLAVTFESSNADLATVDANGVVTLVEGATGSAVITATFAGDDTYKAGSVSYGITVVMERPFGFVFYETFAGTAGTGGHDDQFGGNVATSKLVYDEEGWAATQTKINGAKQSAKFGTGSDDGILVTPAITLTGNGTLTFAAAGWASGTNSLSVSATGATLSGDVQVTLENGAWKVYTVNVTGATGNVVLTFTGKRGFIDDIAVAEVPATYTRTVTPGNFGTICLPYDARVEGAELYLIEGKTVNADDNTATAIVLSQETSLEAGIPYIFKATADKLVATITSNTFKAADNFNGLYGTYPKQAIEAGSYLISQNQVVKCGEGCYAGINRAYINLDEVGETAASGVKLFFSDTATGIAAVKGGQQAGVAYDMTGRRVNAAKAGLYIVNGKKVVK